MKKFYLTNEQKIKVEKLKNLNNFAPIKLYIDEPYIDNNELYLDTILSKNICHVTLVYDSYQPMSEEVVKILSLPTIYSLKIYIKRKDEKTLKTLLFIEKMCKGIKKLNLSYDRTTYTFEETMESNYIPNFVHLESLTLNNFGLNDLFNEKLSKWNLKKLVLEKCPFDTNFKFKADLKSLEVLSFIDCFQTLESIHPCLKGSTKLSEINIKNSNFTLLDLYQILHDTSCQKLTVECFYNDKIDDTNSDTKLDVFKFNLKQISIYLSKYEKSKVFNLISMSNDLEKLNLDMDSIYDDDLYSNLKNLKNLKHLYLSEFDPKQLSQLLDQGVLTELKLSNLEFNRDLNESFYKNQSLKALDIEPSKDFEQYIESIISLKSLESITFSKLKIKSKYFQQLIEGLNKMKYLKYLSIEFNTKGFKFIKNLLLENTSITELNIVNNYGDDIEEILLGLEGNNHITKCQIIMMLCYNSLYNDVNIHPLFAHNFKLTKFKMFLRTSEMFNSVRNERIQKNNINEYCKRNRKISEIYKSFRMNDLHFQFQ